MQVITVYAKTRPWGPRNRAGARVPPHGCSCALQKAIALGTLEHPDTVERRLLEVKVMGGRIPCMVTTRRVLSRVSFSSCVCVAEQRRQCHSDVIGNGNKHPECLKVPTKSITFSLSYMAGRHDPN
eukprot:jgi/Botrbrau1/11369/Bobra.0038s0117.1